ncbi:winged helix-turn-helix domain-containing protein [Natronomonas gomsonensis]|jgi:predicted transcriptional regulator|uniref:winged helix-turn-helix domain-containing protein n=1 Tax=Natronomonas gomsonensis TaxID=1046043 RepID=UPI0020CA64CD|nr:winged helix-turn-helix domain-containing protein [Natronomonas gomsonensis]MCY4729221.1 winged helix-turn-helix domain-containing protein [Natronomonas gomsonensis]
MSTDDSSKEGESEIGESEEGVREKLEQEAERAAEQFDEGIVDLLAWVLDTETRARIYVYLRQNPGSTSEEVAEGTGLYPSTVREALAALHEEEKLDRSKRESSGAGNNPYEYTAMAPSDLVGTIVDDLQEELNTVFNLDSHLGIGNRESVDPVDITVEDGSENSDDTESADGADDTDD